MTWSVYCDYRVGSETKSVELVKEKVGTQTSVLLLCRLPQRNPHMLQHIPCCVEGSLSILFGWVAMGQEPFFSWIMAPINAVEEYGIIHRHADDPPISGNSVDKLDKVVGPSRFASLLERECFQSVFHTLLTV